MLKPVAGSGNSAPLFSSPPTDPLPEWFRRAQSEVFTVTVMMTPDLAQRLLDRNPGNRTLLEHGHSRSMSAYAAAMARGEWELNGAPIIVSADGLLNDGQHRLTAVVRSGVCVPMQVTFGVARSSRKTLDRGRARTLGDVLAIHGETSSNILATAVQFVFQYEGECLGRTPSEQQTISVLQEHPGIRDAVKAASKLSGEFRLSHGFVGGAYYVCRRANEAVADTFLATATSGLNISDTGSPVHHLRRRYQAHLTKRARLHQAEQAAIFIKAFNKTLAKRNVRALDWVRTGPNAEAFPVAGIAG